MRKAAPAMGSQSTLSASQAPEIALDQASPGPQDSMVVDNDTTPTESKPIINGRSGLGGSKLAVSASGADEDDLMMAVD